MRILMVTPFYLPAIGGTEVFVGNLATKLNKSGFQVDVMTFDPSAKPLTQDAVGVVETNDGVNVLKVHSSKIPEQLGLHKLLLIRRIPIRFRKFLDRYDIVHFHNDVDLSFPVFSYFSKKPKIFHCHVLSATFDLYKSNLMIRLMLKNIAQTYIAVSHHVANLLEGLGIPSSKIVTVHNGVDPEKFRPERKNREENMILFAGRIEPYKGLHVLLKSLDYIRRPLRLVVAGALSWNEDYNNEAVSLIDEVNKKGVHKVEFSGHQSTDEMKYWYQHASMLVAPSIRESFGLVVLEAMACETPVIASGVGGIPEIIENRRAGILVPPCDSLKLAKEIEHLLDDEKLRRSLGQEGRRVVTEKFSYDVVVGRLIEIYRALA